MDSLSVVSQLRDLAADPQNREAIVQDEGCLPGLVLFLDHRDPRVQRTTLETLRYLAEASPNAAIMKEELGMMISLESLMDSASVSDDITARAREVLALLNAPAHPVPPCANAVPHTPLPPSATSVPPSATVPCTPERQRKKKPQFFINSTNKKAKSVTLHIEGLDSTIQRGVCEEALLKVKGVISFTFQMTSKRCTVRMTSDLPTEKVASAIAATKVMSAQQVVHNEEGQEVLVSLKPLCPDEEIQQNASLPDYLPEEEEKEPVDQRAVQCTGAKDQGQGSWINTAATFLSRNFYW